MNSLSLRVAWLLLSISCAVLLPANARESSFRSDQYEERIRLVKRQILRSLGYAREPDATRANITDDEMRRMYRLYQQTYVDLQGAEVKSSEEGPRTLYSFTDEGKFVNKSIPELTKHFHSV